MKYEFAQYKDTFLDILIRDGLLESEQRCRQRFSCISPEHEDQHPSMSYDPQSFRIHCFSCGKSYDVYDYVGQKYNLKNKVDQLNKVKELAGVVSTSSFKGRRRKAANEAQTKKNATKKDFRPYFLGCQQHTEQFDYLAKRGISKDVATRFGIGFDPKVIVYEEQENNSRRTKTEWQAIVIPTSPTAFKYRNINSAATHKNRYRIEGCLTPFNFAVIEAQLSKPIWLVEGEIDAMSVIEAGGEAVAIGSTSGLNIFKSELGKLAHKEKLRFVLALDSDDAGKSTQQDLKEFLLQLGIKTIEAPSFPVDAKTIKDMNDFLQLGKDRLSEFIQETEKVFSLEAVDVELEEYIARVGNAGYMQTFRDHLKEGEPDIPTGFVKLDELLGGGLRSGLYVVGAMPGAGKTSFVLQIADQIASGTNSCSMKRDILYFSLEMSKDELIARSVSRLTMQIGDKQGIPGENWKSALDILSSQRYLKYNETELELIKDAIDEYEATIAPRMFIFEGVADHSLKFIEDAVSKHIEKTGHKPIIILDYLQIMPQEGGLMMTDKQATDRTVVALKRISHKHRLPVVVISSLNRTSYRADAKDIDMSAYKESGAIEYTADVLLALENKPTDARVNSKKGQSAICLRFLKNRLGMANCSTGFLFHGAFNCFEEPTVKRTTPDEVEEVK
jgi:replicative DNA helicase